MRLIAVLLGVMLVLVGCRQSKRPSPPTTHPKEKVQRVDRYWQEARHEVYKTVPQLTAQHQTELARGIVLRKLMRGSASRKQIAITFDDGPHAKYTPKLLAILKQYDARATFFVVGRLAERHPDLIRAEIAAGHDVGNHTYDHVNLTKLPLGQTATEIQACGDVLKAITHKRPSLFRPPGGDYNTRVGRIANDLDYTMVLWTDDPGDYADPGEKVIFNRVMRKVRNGGIILIHDGIQQTVDILPKILQTLKNRGYQFVTVDQMMRGTS